MASRYSESYMRGAARLREAGRSLRLRRPARDQGVGELDDGIKEMIDIERPVMVDMLRRPEGELLPDDPVAARRTTRCCSARRRHEGRRSRLSEEGMVLV